MISYYLLFFDMIYSFILLVFIVGLILGLYFNFPTLKFLERKSSKSISTLKLYQYFNEFEIQVFVKILSSKDKCISNQEIDFIIGLGNGPLVELNRLRRNFLKDLNLKIQIIFGISNGIWQIDSVADKKYKYYKLSKKFNLTQLNKIFLP
jgi:hypothetical protein